MQIKESLSFEDVLLVPGYSEVLPGSANVKTRLVGDIELNVPIISAAMDTVTEEELAITIALEGGAGIIHRNLSPEEQARQVLSVKRFLNWIIDDPITVNPDNTVLEIKEIMRIKNVSGLPVIDNNGKLCGIITGRDLRFCSDETLLVKEIMTKKVIVVKENETTVEIAKQKFDQYKIEKLPVVDNDGHLTGLITFKDIEKHNNFPEAAIDKHGRLIAGAAISPQDYKLRIPLLKESKVDFVVIDTSHGEAVSVVKAIKDIKQNYDILVIGGNVVTEEGAQRLIDAGADAIKVGIGPGSICTTRVIAGIGVPQFSAVMWAAKAAAKANIPVIADGGIKFSGDIVKAVAAGANCIMIGNLFAGLKESPGKEIIFDGRMFKQYRGMGSIGAIKDGSGDRYQMKEGDAPVPEGIEGRVPYKGELKPFLHQLVTGLKKGMAYCGCSTLDELRQYKNFVKISPAGLKESHAHDVVITREAPNYSR